MNTYLFYRDCDFLKWPIDSDAYRIYLPMKSFENSAVTEKLSDISCEVFAIMPWIKSGNTDLDSIKYPVDGFLAENIGDLEILRERKFACDASLNITNTHTLEFLRDAGAVSATISPEANVLPDVSGIIPEYITDGPIVVMKSEHCPVATAVGCAAGEKCGECLKRESRTFTLEDKNRRRFPVICDNSSCRVIILSSEDFKTAGRIPENALRRINIFYGDEYDG